MLEASSGFCRVLCRLRAGKSKTCTACSLGRKVHRKFCFFLQQQVSAAWQRWSIRFWFLDLKNSQDLDALRADKEIIQRNFWCKPQASCDDIGESTESVNNFAMDQYGLERDLCKCCAQSTSMGALIIICSKPLMPNWNRSWSRDWKCNWSSIKSESLEGSHLCLFPRKEALPKKAI